MMQNDEWNINFYLEYSTAELRPPFQKYCVSSQCASGVYRKVEFHIITGLSGK